MRRYLLQLTTFLAPRSVEVADTTLRQFTRWLTTSHRHHRRRRHRPRGHVEDYKVWLAAQPGQKGKLLAKNTQRHRLRMIRIFLERLIEWDWPDAPGRNPILHGDIPPRSEPIPKFLTDQQAAAFMAAARAHPVAALPARRPGPGPHRPARLRALRARRRLPSPGSAPTATGCASRSASSATTA